MVAQCASLVHKVAIAGWELMQFPWVRAISGEREVGSEVSLVAVLGTDSAETAV